MKTLLCGIVGAAGLAASANAAVSWTTQTQFRQGTAGAVIPGNVFNLTANGTYTFTVMVGIFNFSSSNPSDANYGLYDWTANATATGLANAGETLGVTPASSRVAPFNFGPATSFGGTLGGGGTTITSIDCARDVSGGATAPWLWDSGAGAPGPQPTLPNNPSPGSNAFTNVWRFTVNVTDFTTGPDIVVSFAGSAGPITQWVTFGATQPEDEATPGFVSFLGLTRGQADGGPLAPYQPFSLTLRRVPAPGAMALLGLGGLIAARRRRA